MTHYKKSHLEKIIYAYIDKHQKIITFCFGKKRPLYFTKYIDANKSRTDGTKRLWLFELFLKDIWTADSSMVHRHSENEYEIRFSHYVAHIREETIQKDKILFLISTFEKQAKK